MTTRPPVKLFISYAKLDRQKWLEPIQQHLRSVQNLGAIDPFEDSQIRLGDEWDRVIRRKLSEADIIVLIVTPAFLASTYCTSVEVQEAMDQHGKGQVRVVPIIADYCNWEEMPFRILEALPKDKNGKIKPLADWRNKNEPLAAAAKKITMLARDLAAQEPRMPAGSFTTNSSLRPISYITDIIRNHKSALLTRVEHHDWWANPIPLKFIGQNDQPDSNARDTLRHWMDALVPQHCAILGDPGAGKSGLIWWMASQLALTTDLLPLVIPAAKLKQLSSISLDHLSDISEPKLPVPLKSAVDGLRLFVLLDGLDELFGIKPGEEILAANLVKRVLQCLPNDSRVVVSCRAPVFVLYGNYFLDSLPKASNSNAIDQYKKSIIEAIGLTHYSCKQFLLKNVEAACVEAFLTASNVRGPLLDTAVHSIAYEHLRSTPFMLNLLAIALPDLAAHGNLAIVSLYRTYVRALLKRESQSISMEEISSIEDDLSIAARYPMYLMKPTSTELARRAQIISDANGGVVFSHYSLWEYFFAEGLFREMIDYRSMTLARLDLVRGYNVNRMLVPMMLDNTKQSLQIGKWACYPISAQRYLDFVQATGWRAQTGYGIHPVVESSLDGTPSASFRFEVERLGRAHRTRRHREGIASAISWYDAAIFARYIGARLPRSSEFKSLYCKEDLLFWCSDWYNEANAHISIYEAKSGEIYGLNPDVRLPNTALALFGPESQAF